MTINQPRFHDEASLSDIAEEFGKKALKLGLIPSFVVRYFADSRQFYIPDETRSDALTPEEAYMRLKQLLEQSNSQ